MQCLTRTQLTSGGARLILVGLAVLIATGLATPAAITPPSRDEARSVGDTNLQLWTIQRIRNGDPYYTAVGDELRKHAYPTTPIINWRTPLFYEAIAALSVDRAGTLLWWLAMAAVVTGSLAYSRHSVSRAVAGALFLLAAMAPAMLVRPGAVVFPETWAGVLVVLSLNAYTARLWVPAALLGVVAVFVRELVAPYALVCGLLALKERRRPEALVWVLGGGFYLVYYAAHAYAAMAAVQPGDLVREQSYLRMLGPHFVFMTLFTYGGLVILPAFVTPVAAALGLTARWARSAPPQLTVSLLLYFTVFCFVGQPFNFYWGFFTCALWGHAFVYAAEGSRALMWAARGGAGRDAHRPALA